MNAIFLSLYNLSPLRSLPCFPIVNKVNRTHKESNKHKLCRFYSSQTFPWDFCSIKNALFSATAAEGVFNNNFIFDCSNISETFLGGEYVSDWSDLISIVTSWSIVTRYMVKMLLTTSKVNQHAFPQVKYENKWCKRHESDYKTPRTL